MFWWRNDNAECAVYFPAFLLKISFSHKCWCYSWLNFKGPAPLRFLIIFLPHSGKSKLMWFIKCLKSRTIFLLRITFCKVNSLRKKVGSSSRSHLETVFFLPFPCSALGSFQHFTVENVPVLSNWRDLTPEKYSYWWPLYLPVTYCAHKYHFFSFWQTVSSVWKHLVFYWFMYCHRFLSCTKFIGFHTFTAAWQRKIWACKQPEREGK